jgi:hypothetical protein
MRDLEQNPGAVPRTGITAHRTAVRKIFKDLQSFTNNFVGFVGLHIDNKPDPTGVSFKRGVVEALSIWKSVKIHPFNILKMTPWCQSFFPELRRFPRDFEALLRVIWYIKGRKEKIPGFP